ncbi:MAG: CarD family transcriptional regulator [Clostridia bacterium]|nr:CarD family transcriptional regulator [Clostridia bacterium]
MYKINDKVLYATDGVCVIEDIAERTFGGKTETYYILKPYAKAISSIMIPVANEVLVSRIRRLLSVDEVLSLIDRMPQENSMEWIEDRKTRNAEYRSIIIEGDRVKLVRLIRTIYRYAQRQKEIGKKIHAQDERALGEAERILYDEFSVVLGIKREDVLGYIRDRLKNVE